MSSNVNLKSLAGEYVKTATLVKWHKKEGDKVKKNEPLVTVETAKVTIDIPAPESGIILKIFFKNGDDVDINDTIAIIGELNESISNHVEQKKSLEKKVQQDSSIKNIEEESNRIFISPIAKVIAKKNNIDLNEIKKGSGPKGMITKEDMLKFQKSRPSYSTEQSEKPKSCFKIIKITGRREAIRNKISNSYRNIPHVTIMLDVEIGRLKQIKDDMNNKEGVVKLSLTDFIIYLTVKSLKMHPMLNANFENNEIKVFYDINLGVAVDLEEGLLVPVIRKCNEKSLYDISAELKQLVEKSKQKKIVPNEVKEGTFTITNLGMVGIKYFTPIINEPEVAILGIGKIEKHKNEILPLSLSFDHRVIDGAPAGRFLNTLKEIIENANIYLFE